MMNLPTGNEEQELYEFFVSLLNEQTPRAMIIIGAARLEGELKEIVHLVVPYGERICRSHGARIELLCAVQQLSEDMRNCLTQVARIRNHFAHSWKACSLHDKEIAENVTRLFEVLEIRFNFSKLTATTFPTLLAKVKFPKSLLAQTLIDPSYQRFHIGMSLLLRHLRIIKCNTPAFGRPIELGEWENVNWSGL